MICSTDVNFEELFTRWQSKYSFNAFIKDGIVDTDGYERPHILFVLRDMNCSVSNDLRKCLRDHGSGHKTWNNIARWTTALLDGKEEYPMIMSREDRIKQLRRVAAINIKKEGGSARSNGSELIMAAETQRDMLLEQIELCDPQIIICCGQTMRGAPGNAVILEQKVFGINADWESIPSQTLNKEWYYFRTELNGKNVPVVSFCHPQVTNLCGKRGHKDLFEPLYRDMLMIRKYFLI